jgi:putative chitinase
VQPDAATPGQQRFNSFDEVMTGMLPTQGGTAAHVTSHAGMRTLNGRPDLHEGVDFNYVGGQTGINRQHPTINSPVSGTVIGVTSGAGSYGAIRIRDERGYEHRILHTHDQLVEAGQTVTAGVTPIGTMGGRGPNGPNQYPQHVDYRIKDQQGNWVNPERHWNEGIDVRMAAAGRLEQSDVLRTAFANVGNTDRLQTALAGTDATRAHELQKAQLQADATVREKTPDAQETRTAASIEERGHMA